MMGLGTYTFSTILQSCCESTFFLSRFSENVFEVRSLMVASSLALGEVAGAY